MMGVVWMSPHTDPIPESRWIVGRYTGPNSANSDPHPIYRTWNGYYWTIHIAADGAPIMERRTDAPDMWRIM